MVTRPSTSLASRVSTSLLLAARQTATLARTSEDYADIATIFLNAPTLHTRPHPPHSPLAPHAPHASASGARAAERVRAQFEELREGSEIFHNRVFARRLEKAFIMALDLSLSLPPRAFSGFEGFEGGFFGPGRAAEGRGGAERVLELPHFIVRE